MTESGNDKLAEQVWLQQSDEENFFFSMFQEPACLRRSRRFGGALASLTFGRYTDLRKQVVLTDRAVWLDMIVSDIPGHGGLLLDEIIRICSRHDLTILGTPTPLKPRDWKSDRPFDYRPETLICWYSRHGFRILQDGSETRVIHVPKSSALEVTFHLR